MRLIDADALDMYERLKSYYGDAWRDAQEEIDAQPTVDAVPVIRCKDCQYWMKNPINESSEWGLCFKHKDVALATDETDWCSWAERRTE